MDLFKTVHDVVFGGGTNPVLVYYPPEKKVEHVGVRIRSDLAIEVDHLPKSGYYYSSYLPREYGKKILVFKGDMYPYWETMFLDSKKDFTVFFLETGKTETAHVAIIPYGAEMKYLISYENGQKQYERTAYEKKFIILK